MAFESLLAARRIHAHRATREEVDNLLALAERDLRLARVVVAEDWDWGFSIAYNGILQASRAYMYWRGYRPAADQGHRNTFAFMREALGEEYATLVGYFDRMRKKRNHALYDVAGVISEHEARTIIARAGDLLALVRGLVTGGGEP